MTVALKAPERKQVYNPVGSSEDKRKAYLIIADMPYAEGQKVGAKISYKDENVEKTVDEKDITVGTEDQSLKAFEKLYRPRLVNDLNFVVENIKKPSIYFEKVDKATKEKLKGAEFELQKKIGEKYESIDKDGKKTIISKWTATSGDQGKFSFESIPDGEYQVYETKAPAGYSLINRVAFKFKVQKGKIYEIDKKTEKVKTSTLKVNGEENSDTNRIPITNQKAEYPYTGGPGTWIGFTIIGIVVMTLAGLIYNKRKARQAE